VLHQDRHDPRGETIVVGIHHFQRHLHGIEGEIVLEGGVQQVEVNLRTFMSGDTNVTDAGYRSFAKSRSFSNQISLSLKPGKLALSPLGFGNAKTCASPILSGLAPAPSPVGILKKWR
jgi:hypothetical protein